MQRDHELRVVAAFDWYIGMHEPVVSMHDVRLFLANNAIERYCQFWIRERRSVLSAIWREQPRQTLQETADAVYSDTGLGRYSFVVAVTYSNDADGMAALRKRFA
jgi:hypothetical protein